MTRRWATIEDVAEAAGVSAATVSRALRNLPHVAPSTRARVQSVARELDYRPDPGASALAGGRTRVVGMTVPMLDSWYFSKVMAGAEAVLADAGYHLLLCSVDVLSERHRLLDGPFVKRADGLILVDLGLPDAVAEALLARPVRVVTVGMELAGMSSVVVDDFEVGRRAVDHLLGLGHRHIALIEGSPHDSLRFTVPDQRRLGHAAALEGAGLVVDPELTRRGEFSVSGGRTAMASLLDLPEPPTAVFAMSDEMAFGALQELWSRGLDAPGDLSIIGVDDHEMAEVLGLTTIAQEVSAHGALAAEILLDELGAGDRAPVRRLAETNLIPRRTTGPVPT